MLKYSSSRLDALYVCSVSFLYGGLVLGPSFARNEIIGLIVSGMAALLMFSALVHKTVGGANLGASLQAYKAAILSGTLGWKHSLVSCVIVAMAQAVAVMLTNGGEDWKLSTVEGIRTGVFLTVALTAWRLEGMGRVAVIATWIATDIFVYASALKAGPLASSAMLTLVVGAIVGWVALGFQRWLDETLLGARR